MIQQYWSEYWPEIVTFCTVFIVLSSISFLYSNSTIIRWIIRFMILRALLPLAIMAGIYWKMR